MTRASADYQSKEDWMGTPVLTLADVWPAEPIAAIVGLNPALLSVSLGHYYQGSSGQRQMQRLVAADIMRPPHAKEFEDVVLEARIGLTDIVKRPTAGEAGVSKSEIAFGAPLLVQKLEARGVDLIICVFRHPVKALLGVEGAPGLIEQRTSWGARVFRMPGPFHNREDATDVLRELRSLLG